MAYQQNASRISRIGNDGRVSKRRLPGLTGQDMHDFDVAMKSLDQQASSFPRDVLGYETAEADLSDLSPFRARNLYDDSEDDDDASPVDVTRRLDRLKDSSRNNASIPKGHFDRFRRICAQIGLKHAVNTFEIGLRYAYVLVDDGQLQQAYHDLNNPAALALSSTVLLFVAYRSGTARLNSTKCLSVTCGTYFASLTFLLGVQNNAAFEQNVRQIEDKLKRGGFLRTDWYQNIPLLVQDPPPDDHARHWLDVFNRFGRLGLADLIMEEEKTSRFGSLWKSIDPSNSGEVNKVRLQILLMLSVEKDEYIKSCITRQLARHRMIRGHPVRAILKQRAQWAMNFPCQYVNIICDSIGLAPTAYQCETIRNDLLLYLSSGIESNRIASEIDFLVKPPQKWQPRLTTLGLRRYPDDYEVFVHEMERKGEGRRQKIREFLQELEARLEPLLSVRPHEPLDQPLVEVGYAKNVTERLKAHANHRNSNYLMNLVQAAFERRYPGRFILHQEALSLCFNPWHTWFGEISFTRMLKGYTTGASGFSHHPAGYSNGSAYRRLDERQWDRLTTHMDRLTNLEENYEREKQQALSLQSRVSRPESVTNALSMLEDILDI